jgi:hypothetical protein
MKGMLDINNEVKVAHEFWNFLGGKGTYSSHKTKCHIV